MLELFLIGMFVLVGFMLWCSHRDKIKEEEAKKKRAEIWRKHAAEMEEARIRRTERFIAMEATQKVEVSLPVKMQNDKRKEKTKSYEDETNRIDSQLYQPFFGVDYSSGSDSCSTGYDSSTSCDYTGGGGDFSGGGSSGDW